MKKKHMNELLELIQRIVSDPEGSTWQEKRDALLAEADATEKGALEEFASWFQDDETEQKS